jgi:hypothetical protein
MVKRIKRWLTQYKERRRQRRILNQWRALCRRDRLRQLPVDLLLQHWQRSMAACEVAKPAPMGWFPALLRPWRLIARKTGCANSNNASPNLPPPPLSPGQVRWVKLKRRLGLFLLCLGLRVCRWFLGLLLSLPLPRNCSRT